jgi:Na+/melibiose symporter-like transporter
LYLRYQQGQHANSTAGILNAALMIVFSMLLVAVMLKSSLRIRYIYAACLYVGGVALIMAKFVVLHSVPFAEAIVTIMAVPISAINAFPFALVGAMNKRAQANGQEQDTGVQMGVLNIFVTLPQLIATVVVGALRARGEESALPWAFLMAGVSFGVAGSGALFLNDSLGTSSAREVRK